MKTVLTYFPLYLFLALSSCSQAGMPFWDSDQSDHLYKSRDLYENGDMEGALKMVNRDISRRGEEVSNLLTRIRINIGLGRVKQAEEDAYLAFAVATRRYFENNDPNNLYMSAFFIGVLGDQERARSILHLVKQRHPEFTLTATAEKISNLASNWHENSLKIYPR